ncbi:MAG: methionine gamma-lyase family protein [Oscillospiraceae bacterium]|nr:methionine gamma-lyase family protein [Oscillospiraceae bacterium]
MSLNNISPAIKELSQSVENDLHDVYAGFDLISEACTLKVMSAFQEFRVSEACFAGTTGYGYNDLGRDTLDKIYARVFGAEGALVRIGFVNGTHAIATALFAVCKPGDTLLSVTGTPYDTLQCTIGIAGDGDGSLKFFGVNYDQVELLPNGDPDIPGIKRSASDPKVKAIMIQRSRGYALRRAFGINDIEKIIKAVREVNPTANILVDNCYGEFTELREPTEVGADLIAGSLIKNPGGGLAPTGGYIAGRRDLIERAAIRMTTPGIGGECGSTLGNNRLLYQGFFIAPHIVAQALKTASFCAGMMERLGYKTSPNAIESRHDIIQMVEFGSADKLLKFCTGIQHGSPVDSYVTPVPWEMPGYEDQVVMAAGAFIQGSSIELSCDGPMRAPYLGFMQGGLTYESGKLGVMLAADEIAKSD